MPRTQFPAPPHTHTQIPLHRTTHRRLEFLASRGIWRRLPNKPATRCCIAPALLLDVTQRLKPIIICQLLLGWNDTRGKNADTKLAVDIPLFNVAIGIAAVVDEARVAAHCASIDESTLLELEEVMVWVALIRSPHAAFALLV